MSEYRVFNTMNSYWMEGTGRDSDIVISSRVRLARNSPDYPFPDRLSLQQEREFLEQVAAIPKTKAGNGLEDLEFIDLALVPREEKMVLVEKHQISPALALSDGAGGLLINAAETLSVMINEEDHLRIQSIYPGLSVGQCWEKAAAADDMIAKYIPPAFSERWGYLTSCPTNTGTGMRASVMLHLPALVWTNRAKKLFDSLGKYGFTCRGLYGEGTEGKGNLFQVSNQITMGLSEQDILERLNDIVSEIVSAEREMRRTLMEKDRIALEDKVFRAEAILKNARLVEIGEAFSLLSALRLGSDLELVKGYSKKDFNRLLLLMQPVILEKMSHKKLTKNEMMQCRGDLLRSALKGGES
ncbi:MAG: protein arginine kinase [Firmicutes bacterium]|nr:protein arginine kinase [Bacillota bacterium]MBQ4092644.1 protein arginine kinase [Bacillota bacterium]MBQ6811242.1 protein arginine kinase [Bacillota bacterium]